MTVTFVALEAFTEELLRVADEETLRQFELELAADPEAGDLIRYSGGLRKARMKLRGRGRSSGARVILPLAARGATLRAIHALYQSETGGCTVCAARTVESGR